MSAKKREPETITLYCASSASEGYEALDWAKAVLTLADILWILKQMSLVAMLRAMGEQVIGIKYYSGLTEFGSLTDTDHGFCDERIQNCDWGPLPEALLNQSRDAEFMSKWEPGRTDGDQIIISEDECYFGCWPHHGDIPGLIDTQRLSKAELEGYAKTLLATAMQVETAAAVTKKHKSRRRVIEVD